MRTMGAVSSLIPGEMHVFDGFGTDSNYSGYLWYSPPGTVSDEQVGILSELIHEHPCFNEIIERRIQKTINITDYCSLNEFHRTALYNEFYKLIGGTTQMAVPLHVAPELFITCSMYRLKSGFSEYDRTALDLLTPHLISAFRNAQFINRLKSESEQLQMVFELGASAVMTVDSDLKLQIRESYGG